MKSPLIAAFALIAVASLTSFADEAPKPIPGIDFSKPGPSPSPSASDSAVPRLRPSKRKAKPAVGVSGAANNQGYAGGAGKVKIGF